MSWIDLNSLLERVQQEAEKKKICVVGVTYKSKPSIAESVIRSRLQVNIPFIYYEACIDSKKGMRCVREGISHSVIQSQL